MMLQRQNQARQTVARSSGLQARCCRPLSLRCHATSASAEQAEEPVHVTIVGAGAAGLTAAFFAAEHGAKVTVLERTREAGKKVLMSGGSRCNVLPLEADLQTDFFTESSFSAMKAVFASWNLDLCKAWLEDPYWGVGLDLDLEEETKKWFPVSNSSKEVRDKLVAACLVRGVEFRYETSVEGLRALPVEEAGEGEGQREAEAQGAAGGRQGEGSSASAAGGAAAQAAAERQSEPAGGSGEGEGAAGVGSSGSGSAGGEAKGGSKGKGRGKGKGKGRAGDAAGAAAAAGGVGRPKTRWLCRLKDGTEHVTDKLIVATGGMSFPAVGTDGTGLRLLRQLGHTLHAPYPALTPLTGSHPAGEQLAGVSMYGIELSVQLPAAKRPKVSQRTALLFTHKGYSGPAVLDLSHYAVMALTRGSVPPPPPPPPVAHGSAPTAPAGAAAKQPAAAVAGSAAGAKGGAAGAAPGAAAKAAGSAGAVQGQPPAATAAPVAAAPSGAGGGGSGGDGGYTASGLPSIRVNWTHETAQEWDERLRAGSVAQLGSFLQRHGLRERLADALVAELGLGGKRVCDLKRGERAALVGALTSYELRYGGHEGYKKAEVTGGGVRLEDIDCATMESRLLPGLYLCGEVCDVFGRIGGFNFYWAWVSGRLAGVGAAQGGLHPKKGAKKGAGAALKGEAAAAAATA